jgi:MoxR-like ATPase
MTVAEAPPRAARKRPAKVKVAPEDFLRVAQFLNTKVLVERPVEIRVMNLALIAGINAHLNGSPGVAKSLGLDEYAKCIVGATYFKKPLNEDLSPSRVLGEWDYPRFMRGDTSELERKIAGYAPTADIIFVDEVFRANGLMLDALLPLANVGEREFEHNGGMAKAPVKLMVSAANFNPDPDNVRAQAYLDRVTVMLWVERVKASDSFKEILRRAQARREHTAAGTWGDERETITIEQVVQAQREAVAVQHTTEYLDAMWELREGAEREGLPVSDRRWVELDQFAHANAWLAGRDHLIAEDVAVMEFGMAREKSQVPIAHKLVLKYHGRYEAAAAEKRNEAAAHIAKWEEIRAGVEAVPATEKLDPSLLRQALGVSHAIDEVKESVDAVLAEADREKRDAANLRDLSNELLAIQRWAYKNSIRTLDPDA